ncbi:uncharacterized protein [Venturia canescens]|uniref:uncharacterized protein n=1 Tax=Venturia canescens TaxID=32260 RepID=UPI001C9BE51E|nr:uncharacterized protein LOC122409095 [Venturia canescens]XP_043272283.1 uncharacterized protein LOC122409095 [Venturia canescens]
MAIAKIKSLLDSGLKNVTAPLGAVTDRIQNLEPEVGIRMVHCPTDKTLRVMVLGARHLPQNFGFTKVNSYVVKIKLLPDKQQYETTSKNESWPQWNEEFTFKLRKETKSRLTKPQSTEEGLDASRFVIATLYAILENKPLISSERKGTEKENATKQSPKKGETTSGGAASGSNESKTNKFFGQLFDKKKGSSEATGVDKKNVDKRRVIGATTISLDPKNFVTKQPKSNYSNDVSTGEIWKPLRAITSGISGADERRESQKGQVELVLTRELTEKKDGTSSRLVLSLSRLRCSLQMMHEQETLKGQLYIKMSVIEDGRVTQFWKSNRFPPSVSLKFATDEARVVAENPIDGVFKDASFVVKFTLKNKMGKKTPIGQLEIGPDVGGSCGDQWKEALEKPGRPITKWQKFE